MTRDQEWIRPESETNTTQKNEKYDYNLLKTRAITILRLCSIYIQNLKFFPPPDGGGNYPWSEDQGCAKFAKFYASYYANRYKEKKVGQKKKKLG